MKKIILLIVLGAPVALSAQIGVKAGYNFANVTKASSINANSRSGFHIGGLMAPASKSIVSSRTELIFSRQGYDYRNATNTGNVDLDYIQVGQMMSINITRYISLLFGAQTAYLISAQVDSTDGTDGSSNGMMDLYNRIDYGYAVGAEAHPISGLLVGARFNVSLGKLYKSMENGQMPTFSTEDMKNNVVQLYVGWRFGGNAGNKKTSQ